MHIAVIGAGHAGVESALQARKAGADVTLFSEEAFLPYFRPRLPALAFGHAERNTILMHPADWYTAQGIQLRLNAPVTAFDPTTRQVTAGGSAETFDAVILACGSRAIQPDLSQMPASIPVLPLWSVAHAEAIRALVRPGARMVVLGGGILGIETALQGQEAGLSVTVLERQNRLMPMQFAPAGSAILEHQLTGLGIAVRTGVTSCGPELECDFVVLAIGSRPNRDLALAAGLATGRGVRVDAHLQTSAPRVFAAGDLAELEGVSRPSVREASSQGKVAGPNAVAAVRNEPLQSYAATPQPLTFKSGAIDLSSEGIPWEEPCSLVRLDDGSNPALYRGLVMQSGRLAGVQAIGTRQDFATWCAKIGAPLSVPLQ